MTNTLDAPASREPAGPAAWIGNVAGLVICAAIAVWQQWSAADMIWSLWISSLAFGMTYFVLAALHFIGIAARSSEDGNTTAAAIIASPSIRALAAVFMAGGLLAFFTLHFGMFHFVHAFFLNMFFPLDTGTASLDFIQQEMRSLWRVLGTTLWRYWPFVICSLAARWRDMPGPGWNLMNRLLFKPYLGVIRMHLLIFVFAGLHMTGLGSWMLYPVMIVYFFPSDLPWKPRMAA